MKSGINPRVGFALAVGLSLTGLLIIKPVLAQVASSTPDAATTTSTIDSTGSSKSTADVTSASSTTSFFDGSADTVVASSSATSTESSEPAPVIPSEPAPQGLSLVHIIGTKYTDYFTDGATETSYPGDPTIDANLGKRDAPIPTHEGLTWVHTTGENLYDTPSGDLEVGTTRCRQMAITSRTLRRSSHRRQLLNRCRHKHKPRLERPALRHLRLKTLRRRL